MAIHDRKREDPDVSLLPPSVRLSFLIRLTGEAYATHIGINAINVHLKEMNGDSVRVRFVQCLILRSLDTLISLLAHPGVVQHTIYPSVVIDRANMI
jgi:hypothetical protein